MANHKELSIAFIGGATEGISAGEGNLKIKNNQLFHYFTPILERWNNKYILNVTRYSLVTGRLQKQLKELIPEEQLVIVKGVSEGYKGSLVDYVMDKKGELEA